MTIYYVDTQNGSDAEAGTSDAPFKTPAKALATVKVGDTVRLRGNRAAPATYYRDKLQIDVSGTTWEADAGHSPTWDGGYSPTTGDPNSYRLGKARPGGLYGKMVSVRASRVTLRGLRVQNVGGGAFGIGSETKGRAEDGYTGRDILIEGCTADVTYGASLDVGGQSKNGKIVRVVVQDCIFLNSSLAWFAPGQGQKAANAVMLKFADKVIFRRNVVARSMKEGVNIDKECEGVELSDNEIHTINHAAVYLNRSRDVVIERNLIYHTKVREFLGAAYDKRSAPVMIKIGDEGKPPHQYGNSSRQIIRNNVVLGGSSCLSVANNSSNYDTQLLDAEIVGNTFIGEVWQDEDGTSRTGAVIEIFQNYEGRPHQDSVFRNNVIYAPHGVQLGKFAGVGGIQFGGNCWYSATGEAVPTAAKGGASDLVADPRLVKPEAKIEDTWPAFRGAANIDNYRPRSDSPLLGAGLNGATIGALEAEATPPPPPPPPEDQDPPQPKLEFDYQWLLDELESAQAQVVAAGTAVGDALLRLDEVLTSIREKSGSGGGE